MKNAMKQILPYRGVEQGPIRPPSEANSLLLRVTRNCPWNHCAFCPIYKDAPFSLRSVEDIKKDIDAIARCIDALRRRLAADGALSIAAVRQLQQRLPPEEQTAFEPALRWLLGGMESVFLQDANSLVVKPARLLEILTHLKARFPQIRRITSYARSRTVAKIGVADLRALREAGLNRLHIGLESGSDTVLQMVKKGATQVEHITAGRKVIEAGMELSEYYMPGLGGQAYSTEHALESAATLNQINPHFIRLRSLAIPSNAPLFEDYQAGRFQPCTDIMAVAEIRLFVQQLEGIDSRLVSDHILNLLPALEGKLPRDKPKLLRVLDEFLEADAERQRLYQIGRRCGLLDRFDRLDDPTAAAQARQLCCELQVTAANVDAVTATLLRRFI